MHVATPLSTLLRDADEASRTRILELSHALEIRDHIDAKIRSALPRMYHCELSIVAPWSDTEVAAAAHVIATNNCKLVSFHALSCFAKPVVEGRRFFPRGTPMSEAEMLKNALSNMKRMRDAAGKRAYLVENNNYFRNGAYESIADPRFLTRVAKEADVGLLLDIGHAEITAKHTESTLKIYVSALPLEKVRQIHLSGITRGAEEYLDSHEALQDIDWKQFEDIRARCPALEYVTIEYYKKPELLIGMLERLRTYI